MKVTLINPPFIFSNKGEIIYSQCLGLLYIAAVLKNEGHEVIIIDALFEGRNQIISRSDGTIKVGLTDEDIIARIPSDTKVVGVSAPFSNLAVLVHNLIEKIKVGRPSVKVVMGGVYPSTQPELAIQSCADYLIFGEGENVLNNLIKYLENSTNGYPFPRGALHNKNRRWSGPIDTVQVEDLDCLPLPARDLVPLAKFTKSPRSQLGYRTATIITSRGCPFDCEFCSVHAVCGFKWRPRAPRLVLEEIDELYEAFRINHIEIEDDNFTLNPDRAAEILEGIIHRISLNKKYLYWSAHNGLRIDSLDDNLMRLIAQSNVKMICLALEHGDPDVLKCMNKRLDLSKVIEVIKLIHKYSIPANIFAIYGYPGETGKRFKNALNFYLELKNLAPHINFSFFMAQPYPGTKLFKRCVQEGYIDSETFSSLDKISNFSTEHKFWIKTEDFDEQEINRRKNILISTLTPDIYRRSKVKNMLPERIVPIAKYLYQTSKKILSQ